MKFFERAALIFALVLGVGLLASSTLWAQTSTNYQNQEHVFNAGGNPAPAITSTNYSITLSSIGDGLTQTGMNSPSYQMDGGFVPAYSPPGEVLNLQFSSKTAFGWDPEPSVRAYEVYRGDIVNVPSGSGACLVSGVTTTAASDATTPAQGQCFFYLVTARNRVSEEGTMGNDSQGSGRVNGSPCP